MAGNSPLLILDNHDSFTYNLVQLVEASGEKNIVVWRSTKIQWKDCMDFRRIIISPGPGLPSDFPLLKEIMVHLGPTHHILGICLGHQAIAESYGAKLKHLPAVRHGMTTPMILTGELDQLFYGVEDKGVNVGLYHSWEVDRTGFPASLSITAETPAGGILALKHRTYDVRGVQFHPESIMTGVGEMLMKNWLSIAKDA